MEKGKKKPSVMMKERKRKRKPRKIERPLSVPNQSGRAQKKKKKRRRNRPNTPRILFPVFFSRSARLARDREPGDLES